MASSSNNNTFEGSMDEMFDQTFDQAFEQTFENLFNHYAYQEDERKTRKKKSFY